MSASVVSVTGSKALGEGHAHIEGILVSRVCLCGEVCFAVEMLPWHWMEGDCVTMCCVLGQL